MAHVSRRLLLTLVVTSSVAILASVSHAAGEPKGGTMVVMSTSLGDITMTLFNKESPRTVRNFLSYVNEKFYDGTIFHRVMPNFMIQGGGFTPNMKEKAAKSPIENEAGNRLKNTAGTLAMARQRDPDSATSQFFINVKDNPALNWENNSEGGYCVFGKVIEGLDIIHKIEQVATGRRGAYENVPLEPIVIQSIRVIGAGQARN